MHQPFIVLLLISAVALLVPVAAKLLRRLRIPIVVGEILLGALIGHSGFDLITPSATLDFLADFGFAFLMFLSGIELDVELLTATGRAGGGPFWSRPLPLAVVMLAATIGLASFGAVGLNTLGLAEEPLLMGLILSTTSLGVVLPVLKEHDLLGTRYGQYLLVAASVADLVTLLLLTVTIAAISRGLTIDLLLLLVLLGLFALVARFSRRFASLPLLRRLTRDLAHTTGQLRVRGAVALLVAWVVVAKALGAEMILGAFLAGTVAGLMAGPEDAQLRSKLDAIGFGFFIPVFFIMVGVNFRASSLVGSRESLLLVPLLVVIAYAVKLLPALLLRARFSWREALGGGSLLSARLSLIIAVSTLALDIGAIDQRVNAAIVLVAAITCTLSPLLFGRVHRLNEQPRRSGVLIAGSGQLAQLLARRLVTTGQQVTIVTDPATAGQSQPLIAVGDAEDEPSTLPGVKVVRGPFDDLQTWRDAGGERAEALVVLRSQPEAVVAICELAREQLHIPRVIAQAHDLQLRRALQPLGVKTVQPALALTVALEGALRFPTAFDVMIEHGDDVEFRDVIVANRAVTGLPLRQLRLPGNSLILSIHRRETLLVAHGGTELELGDRVALLGDPQSLDRAAALIRSPP